MDEKLYLIDLDCYARAEENREKEGKKNPIALISDFFQQKGFKMNSVPLLRIEADNVHWQR